MCGNKLILLPMLSIFLSLLVSDDVVGLSSPILANISLYTLILFFSYLFGPKSHLQTFRGPCLWARGFCSRLLALYEFQLCFRM